MANILLVEDDEALCDLLRYNLEACGHQVRVFADGEEANRHLHTARPDLVILDWMLPGLAGPEICRRMRRRKETRYIPVIRLSARGAEEDRISGFSAGADDYLVKPHSNKELLARINRLLPATQPHIAAESGSALHRPKRFADIEVDHLVHRVRRNGREIHLSLIAFKLLDCLMEAPGRVFTREQLITHVWGPAHYMEERTVDVHIGRLRKALSKGDLTDPIRTVRGLGYSLDENLGAKNS